MKIAPGGPTWNSAAIAFVFVLGFAHYAAAADFDGMDVTAISRELGRKPLYCAQISAERTFCTWRDRRAHHLVCEFDANSFRTGKPCVRRPNNDSMRTYPPNTGKGARKRNDAAKISARKEARSALEATKNIDDVVRLVGAGPMWCQRNDRLLCGWHAARKTPGYVTLARVADSPGRKVALTCTFEANGSSIPGACRAEAAGSSRPPREDLVR